MRDRIFIIREGREQCKRMQLDESSNTHNDRYVSMQVSK